MRLDLTGDDIIVRMCVRVQDESRPAKGSEIVLCAECDTPIWRAKNQVLRNPETGEVVTETHCLCPACNFAHMALSPADAKIVLPTGQELGDLLKELFSEDDDDQGR
jgi:hypothetical protein